MWLLRLRSWNQATMAELQRMHRSMPHCIRRYQSSNHRCYLTHLCTIVQRIQQLFWFSEKNQDANAVSLRNTRSDHLPDLMYQVDDLREESIEDLEYRYSMVHAHTLGPWQAILKAVQLHYSDWETKNEPLKTDQKHPYSVLDVACGPRGQPGTTIASALPKVFVRCTDSCAIAIASVPVVALDVVSSSGVEIEDVMARSVVATATSPKTSPATRQPLKLPPPNLSKSVCNLDQLNQHFAPNSIHAIVCCYGYGLSTNIVSALEQAYTVLIPGGILVLGTWKHSPLLALGHDVLTTLRSGTGDSAVMLLMQHQNDLDVGLPPLIRPAPVIENSEPGEWESLLRKAGFHPADIVSSCHTYPLNMGNTRKEQFNLGTILIREELLYLNACDGGAATVSLVNGLRQESAEDAFWNNLPKYCVETSSIESDTMWMPNNRFSLTVSKK